jgi:acetyl-CoA C-acetyltransferase
MREVVIVSGSRTAIGAFGGALKHVPVVQLGASVIRDVLKKAGLRPAKGARSIKASPEKLRNRGLIEIERKYAAWEETLTPVVVDEVIMGNVLQAGQGQNPARQAMIYAGVPKETPAFTVNMVCASGLKAVALGAASIMCGQSDVVVAGGQENMSLVPMALLKARWGHRMEVTGTGDIYDLMVFDGLFEIFYGYHMGVTAENIAAAYGIGRREQDELGVLSHNRAKMAIRSGWFSREVAPIILKERSGERIFDTDERPMDTDIEKMSRLQPAFKQDGTVTAGNASGINDAAAAVLLMSATKARQMGLHPMARIRNSAAAGVDPAYMGLGPVPAVKKALAEARMKLTDIEAIELNEAFASQAIACMRELHIDFDRPNEVGSGISLGHPIGCTGARQLVTLTHHMQRKDYRTGLVTMCIGGGMGMAMILERS